MTSAIVTIGMPLYNNASTLLRAIASIQSQTFEDWQLIISDDHSSDKTESALKLVDDPRIQKFRQPQNLHFRNFSFVLDQASSPYFCWLAGDDYWGNDFLEKAVKHLQSREECVLASPKCVFRNADGKFENFSSGTGSMIGDVNRRIENYLREPSDNSRMYGLFRTEEVKKSMPTIMFHAWDWSLCARSLLYGEHHEIEGIEIYREKTPTISYVKSVEHDEVSPLTRYFPLYRCSKDILKNGVKPSRSVLRNLLRLNVRKHWEYIKLNNPRLNKLLTPLYWRLMDRL